MINFNPMAEVYGKMTLFKQWKTWFLFVISVITYYNRFRHFWAAIKKLWNYPYDTIHCLSALLTRTVSFNVAVF